MASTELKLKYNQRLNQIGFETSIDISGNVSEEEIYHRTIHWFRDDFQNVKKVINIKDSICNSDTVFQTDTNAGLYNIKKNRNGNYRINGRYLHPHRYKRIGASNYIDICGNINIVISNANIEIAFSNLKLPGYGFLPVEAEVLKPGTLKFKRKYKKLKSEMGKTTAAMTEDLKFWIENYHDIINGVINWRDFEDFENQ